jgi:hypothetical protein
MAAAMMMIGAAIVVCAGCVPEPVPLTDPDGLHLGGGGPAG